MGPKASESTWKCGSRECVGGKLLGVDGQIESATKTGKRLSSICDETVSSQLIGQGTRFPVPQFLM